MTMVEAFIPVTNLRVRTVDLRLCSMSWMYIREISFIETRQNDLQLDTVHLPWESEKILQYSIYFTPDHNESAHYNFRISQQTFMAEDRVLHGRSVIRGWSRPVISVCMRIFSNTDPGGETTTTKDCKAQTSTGSLIKFSGPSVMFAEYVLTEVSNAWFICQPFYMEKNKIYNTVG